MICNYDKSKLSPAGYIVLVDDVNIKLPNGITVPNGVTLEIPSI